MRIRLGGLLCGVLAFGLLVAGCGGGDDDVSRSAFIKEADAVCVKSNEAAGGKIIKVYRGPEFSDPKLAAEVTTATEVKIFAPILVEDAESQLEGIQGLEAPGDDEEQIEGITGAYEAWLTKARENPEEIVVENDIFNEARKLSREFGLVKCAKSPFEEPYVHN